MTDPLVPRTDGRVLQDAVALLREARDDIAFHLRDGSDEVSSDMLHKIDSFLAAPEAGKGHWARDLEVNTSASTVARQPAAGSVMAALEEPTMPMLPNQYHPGPRCSCRECLIRYPDAEKRDSERVAESLALAPEASEAGVTPGTAAVVTLVHEEPNIDALYNDPRKQVHDVMYQQGWEAAVAAMDQEIESIKHDNARLVQANADLATELEAKTPAAPSAAAIALFDYLENRPSTDCEWTKGYNEAKRRTLVLLKAAGVERDMSGFTCKGCGHIRGLTNNCLNCGTPMEGPTFVYTPPKRKGEGTEQCTCGKYPHTKDCGSGDAER